MAQKKLQQRGISPDWVKDTVVKPEQRVEGYGGRLVYQRRYQVGKQTQLLRVVCEQTATQLVVVTAYLTSQVARYWR